MRRDATSREGLYELLGDLCDGLLGERDAARLSALLLSDEIARQEYLAYLQIHAGLALANVETAQGSAGGLEIVAPLDANDERPSFIPPIVVTPDPLAGQHRFWNQRATLFSYGVATLVVMSGLLLGWVREVSHPSEMASKPASDMALLKPGEPSAKSPTLPAPEPDVNFVARVTATADCQWANAADEIGEGSFVPLGRKLAVESGLVEVTYDSGAVILLEGPCSYRVQSPQSGFLSFGALTARVEQPTGGQVTRGENAARFTVCTPTAMVSDLGTEFGVQVDRSGTSRADVFHGKIRVRLVAERSADGEAIELGENQSAQVQSGGQNRIQLTRIAPAPNSYVRQMPQRVPLKLANTGTGFKEGDHDPNWQIVARSDAPGFVAETATIATIRVLLAPDDPTGREYVTHLPNEATRSQWISLTKNGQLPNHVTYTFRTILDLKDRSPKSAVVRMRYLVDDRLTQVRLNGRKIELPPEGPKAFMEWREIKLSEGFVEGKNVLEIDVYNEDAVATRAASPMLFRAELEGSALPRWSRSNSTATTQKRSS